MKNTVWFKDISLKNIPEVGGKNASLGEMYTHLSKKAIAVPNGFAVTAQAYQIFLIENKLDKKIREILKGLDTKSITNLQDRGQEIRSLIRKGSLPSELEKDIADYYKELSSQYSTAQTDVAVRSSATAEDLPGASFAGQQASFLNIVGKEALLEAVKNCFASLFNDRAISYREDKGFDHLKTYLSVGVQKMVRSDKACSGVMFTLEPDTGFEGIVLINGSWGLGELIVQGEVIPDEFQVFKKTLRKDYSPIISKELGTKEKTLIYGERGKTTKLLTTSEKLQKTFTLSDDEVLKLANWAVAIENYYKKPMDIEWAKDGISGKLYIVQARPETIHGTKKIHEINYYKMRKPGKLLVKGAAVGTKIAAGKTRVINDVTGIRNFQEGEVLITQITDPDWEPIMKIASAIVTDEGGRTSHAAIVSRELGIPAIVGTGNATSEIHSGETVTVDCSSGSDGFVWQGHSDWDVETYKLEKIEKPKTHIMVNIGNPNEAYENSFLPNDGVGLAREEFIIASHIKIHPLALINFEKLEDDNLKRKIESLTFGYKDKKDFYVEKLSSGIAQIAAAFYPNDVIVRFSDFKTNEYATLLGGKYFEPKEENPMIGWRGSSRYYDPQFSQAFALECQAVRIARERFGLKNIVVMVPFCRTPEEGKKVIQAMEKSGLEQGKQDLKIYMMVEIPSNIIQAEEFIKIFDGFSIGSNDLTQLTLGIDRDNAHLSHIANERNESVKTLIKQVIKVAKKHNKYIGICGQAPSDYEDFAEFLVDEGISSISLNPDTVVKTTMAILKKEKKSKNG